MEWTAHQNHEECKELRRKKIDGSPIFLRDFLEDKVLSIYQRLPEHLLLSFSILNLGFPLSCHSSLLRILAGAQQPLAVFFTFSPACLVRVPCVLPWVISGQDQFVMSFIKVGSNSFFLTALALP